MRRDKAALFQWVQAPPGDLADGEALTEWLRDHAVADSRNMEQLAGALDCRCREIKIEPPGPERTERMVRAALHAYDDRFCTDICDRISPATRVRLDALLKPIAAAEVTSQARRSR